MERIRPDYRIILEVVTEGSSVLDLGCGDGELLVLLSKIKGTKGQGIEIDQKAIAECVRRGVNVLHGDLDEGLSEYPDKSFHYVILNGSLSEVRHPRKVISEALRVGEKVVVGFPNFCHLGARLQISLLGRVPINRSLPFQWYDTPNLHFLSLKDFILFCRQEGLKVLSVFHLWGYHRVYFFPNLFADYSIFLITGLQG